MALEKGSAEGGTSTSPASNDQLPLAESPQSSDNIMCPICLDIINDQVSVSWCSHAFCFPCILEWSSHKAVCPICREPFRYLLRKVEDNNYEVYSIGPHTSSTRRNRERRARHHSAERRRHHSSSHRQHRSSSRAHSSGHSRDRERDRSRSRRRNHHSHSRGRQAQDYHPSSSSRWQSSWTSETSSDEDQAARHERDVPGRSRRSEHHQ